MADTIIYLADGVPLRAHDNGDGTYSLQTYSGGVPDGGNVAQGTTTDTPSTALEDATSRTGISLWKGIKNFLRTISLLFGQGTPAVTTPNFTTGTNFTLVAANAARKYLLIQNNSPFNIMIALDGATLSGIVPSATNIGLVIPPGGSYESPPNYCPTALVKGYQTSGGTLNTVVVTEA